MYDLLVVGAGPAGMMAAGTAAKLGLRTCLLEKNARPGRKLMITGKGRCNLTNDCDAQTFIAHVPTNGRFLYSAAAVLPPSSTIAFFEGLGLPLKTERGNRVFPQSDRAADVVDALAGFVKQGGATRITGEAERLLLEDGVLAGVVLKNGDQLSAARVLVACGGCSYPATGSTGGGYALARQAGHVVTPLRPSLVPLAVAGFDCAELMGLSLRNIALRVIDTVKKKEIYNDFGELLFTHFGVSGPLVLSASAHMKDMAPGRYVLKLDLKPALTPERLDARVKRDFDASINRNFENSLGALLPAKLIPAAVRRSGILPETKCNQITREQRRDFCALLKGFELEVSGFRLLEEAVVTSGGVCVKEVEPKTMQSKLLPGLYFAGEVLDVDAYTGGFNLQIAFCTGYLAAIGMKKEEAE